jgi:hypothetical protein
LSKRLRYQTRPKSLTYCIALPISYGIKHLRGSMDSPHIPVVKGITVSLRSRRSEVSRPLHVLFSVQFQPLDASQTTKHCIVYILLSTGSPSTAVPFFFIPQPLSPPYCPLLTTSGTGQILPDLPMLNPPIGSLSVES